MEQVSSDLCVQWNIDVGLYFSAAFTLSVRVVSVSGQDWWVRVFLLLVPETRESFVKLLPHDITCTMEQVSSDLCIYWNIDVG